MKVWDVADETLNGVLGEPSLKLQLNCGLSPPKVCALRAIEVPTRTEVPDRGWTASRSLMVQVKLVIAGGMLLSVTVTIGVKTPRVDGVPEINPELGLMESPVGRLVALKERRSPLGSVA